MIELSLGRLAAVLGTELTAGDPATLVTSVVTDSRLVQAGSLFVALPGSRVDGHEHVLPALAAGAVGALTSRDVPPAPCLPVADPLAALGQLGRHVVGLGNAGGLQVVGITGSQGKTSTKDLLAQVLERVAPTVAPLGNLNNEIGVPLTACRITPATRFLVAELGARGVGHIAYLCAIVAPRVGVVLNVGSAHVGEFGGRDAIARAKGELVESLPADGCAVLNADDPLVWAMRERTVAPVLAFSVTGPPPGPGIWAGDLTSDRLGRYAFTLHQRSEDGSETEVGVELGLSGRHQVANAVAAAAAAVAVGLPLDTVAPALSQAGPRSRWRMELTERPDGVVVVNDAYNANPESMRAALGTLVELGRAAGGRTWAVLGDMLELGGVAVAEHTALGRLVAEQQVSGVAAVGEHADDIVAAAVAAGLPPGSALATQDKGHALDWVRQRLQPGDAVLVKASRGLALDTVAEALVSAPGRPAAATESVPTGAVAPRTEEDPA